MNRNTLKCTRPGERTRKWLAMFALVVGGVFVAAQAGYAQGPPAAGRLRLIPDSGSVGRRDHQMQSAEAEEGKQSAEASEAIRLWSRREIVTGPLERSPQSPGALQES